MNEQNVRYRTILAAPPWETPIDLSSVPVAEHADTPAHLYLCAPNAFVPDAIVLMERWGFEYKTNLALMAAEERCVGPFTELTELVLLGVRGKMRTLHPGRRQCNLAHDREDLYRIIEACSPGPYLEVFARHPRAGWTQWEGHQ